MLERDNPFFMFGGCEDFSDELLPSKDDSQRYELIGRYYSQKDYLDTLLDKLDGVKVKISDRIQVNNFRSVITLSERADQLTMEIEDLIIELDSMYVELTDKDWLD